MKMSRVLHFLGFPEEVIPDLLEEAASYDPAILEQAFSDEILDCLPSGCAKKLLGTGLSSSFVFHLAVLDANCLENCSALETFRSALGSSWTDVLNENHQRFAFGDKRVYALLDQLSLDGRDRSIRDLCSVIQDELSGEEENE